MGTPHSAATVEECELVPLFSTLGLYELAGLYPWRDTPIGGAHLRTLDDEFRHTVDEREGGRLRLACFYAELLSRGLGGMAVPRSSAVPVGYHGVGIHAEQKDMTRLASPRENGFKRVFGELVRWVRGIEVVRLRNHWPGAESLLLATLKCLKDQSHLVSRVAGERLLRYGSRMALAPRLGPLVELLYAGGRKGNVVLITAYHNSNQ